MNQNHRKQADRQMTLIETIRKRRGRYFTHDDLANWSGIPRASIIRLLTSPSIRPFVEKCGAKSGIVIWRAR